MLNIQNQLFRMNIANTEKPLFNGFSRFSVHMKCRWHRLLFNLCWFLRFFVQSNTQNMEMLMTERFWFPGFPRLIVFLQTASPKCLGLWWMYSTKLLSCEAVFMRNWIEHIKPHPMVRLHCGKMKISPLQYRYVLTICVIIFACSYLKWFNSEACFN